MAGIYIHIPFCKQACHYCDFYFSTSLSNKSQLVKSIIKEIDLRKDYLPGKQISTIYFGGGTPSLLSESELNFIFEKIYKEYEVDTHAEITLEANPDDLTKEKINELKNSPINRLSIGIQSFFDEDLIWMNRNHSASDSETAVKRAQDGGIPNITIDLIYGLPQLTNNNWKINLQKAFALQVPHISAYCLTVEPNTVLFHHVKTGKSKPADENKNAEQFHILMEEMEQHNFVQYEISNFCTDNNYSRHNSNYWKGEHYIGLGPSAHSFDGKSRQWNIKNNNGYIQSLESGKLNFDLETLTPEQRYNEYILTSLRTIWGADTSYIAKAFGTNFEKVFLNESEQYIANMHLDKKENTFTLTNSGKLIADKIASDLFFV